MTGGTRSRRLLLAAAVVVHLTVLYWPADLSWPGEGDGPGVPGADKLVHLLVFAAVAFTGVRAGVPVVPLAGLLAGHAALSEVVQHLWLPARSGDVGDALADVAGTALGLLGGARLLGGAGARRRAGPS